MNTSLRLFWSGWALTGVCTLLCLPARAYALSNALIVLFALSTALLWHRPTFPHRAAGLATSWMGPLLVAVWNLSWLYLQKPVSFPPGPPSKEHVVAILQLITAQCLWQGCFSGLFFLWLFRGYGAIAVTALVAALSSRPMFADVSHPSPFAEKLRTRLSDYPFRGWWIIPLTVVLFSWLPALLMMRLLFEL